MPAADVAVASALRARRVRAWEKITLRCLRPRTGCRRERQGAGARVQARITAVPADLPKLQLDVWMTCAHHHRVSARCSASRKWSDYRPQVFLTRRRVFLTLSTSESRRAQKPFAVPNISSA